MLPHSCEPHTLGWSEESGQRGASLRRVLELHFLTPGRGTAREDEWSSEESRPECVQTSGESDGARSSVGRLVRQSVCVCVCVCV